jgi:uncharacterized protein
MTASYDLKKNSRGQFSWVLKSGNNEVILTSELYKTRASAENGIEAVRKNSQVDRNYERKTATDGRFYFTMKAANHEVIGTSQMYSSEAHRNDGIAAVKTNGPTAQIRVHV